MMDITERMKRYFLFLIGLIINSFGISFITKADLGTSPISSVPYTLSLAFTPSLGMFTLYMSIILILIQLVLLRKNFPKEYLLQIPVSLLFSYFIDLSMKLLDSVHPHFYALKLLMLLTGCLILGTGVFLEMVADVVMLPGESIVNAIAITFHLDFGKTKVGFDSTMTILAAASGFLFLHRLAGVREGTVLAAFLVGMTARFLKRKAGSFVERFWQKEKTKAPVEQDMLPDSNLVITVSRQFGSGGRQIAKAIAEQLHMKFYDYEIIRMTAGEMHIDEAKIEQKEQKLTNSFLYDLVAQFYDFSGQESELDQLYHTESEVIRRVAQEGNCVIVGRGADEICRHRKHAFHVYLYAEEEYRIHEICRREQLAYDAAKKHVREINRLRSNHYKYYTGRTWGMASNYHLCIDTGRAGMEKTVRMVIEAIGNEEFQK